MFALKHFPHFAWSELPVQKAVQNPSAAKFILRRLEGKINHAIGGTHKIFTVAVFLQ